MIQLIDVMNDRNDALHIDSSQYNQGEEKRELSTFDKMLSDVNKNNYEDKQVESNKDKKLSKTNEDKNLVDSHENKVVTEQGEKKTDKLDVANNEKSEKLSKKAVMPEIIVEAKLNVKDQKKTSASKEFELSLSTLPKSVSSKIKEKVAKFNDGSISEKDMKKAVYDILKDFFAGNTKVESKLKDIFASGLIIKDEKQNEIVRTKKEEPTVLTIDKKTNDQMLPIVENQNVVQANEPAESNTGKDVKSINDIRKEKLKSTNDEVKTTKETETNKSSFELPKEINGSGQDKISPKFETLSKQFNENKQEIFDQFTKQTKVVLSQNQMKFSSFIRPEELGRVDFKFTVKDGKMSGKIMLQSQEAADIFRNSVEELRAVFQKSNVELDKLEITVAGKFLEAQGDGSANGQGESQSHGNHQQEKWYIDQKLDFIESSMSTHEMMKFDHTDGINIYA